MLIMKTAYCIILSCLIFSCNSQTGGKEISNTENKEMSCVERFDLNISLLFYLKFGRVPYSIEIINDSLIIETHWVPDDLPMEYRGRLTCNQYLEIKEMVSALTQKYDRSHILPPYGRIWGCKLKIDGQVYYHTHYFSFTPRHPEGSWRPAPEEIKILIDYIVGISPIQIRLF